jgi:uncharacterized protein YoaH (UPF0181 family)
MQMNIVVQQIMGFFIAEDAKTVRIGVRSGPDTIDFTFPTPDLDGVIDILTQARDAALAKGLPTDAKVQVRQPKSIAVSRAEDFVGAVLVYFDRAEPSRTIFMIGHQAAKDAGQQLMKAGREAGEAAAIVAAASGEARRMAQKSPVNGHQTALIKE